MQTTSETKLMERNSQVIALVIDDPAESGDGRSADDTGAHRLIRGADGRVSLEPVVSREDFERALKDTGCFRRGRAIRDPRTFEVIGYEMEEVRLVAV
jgi:hypothetical protein